MNTHPAAYASSVQPPIHPPIHAGHRVPGLGALPERLERGWCRLRTGFRRSLIDETGAVTAEYAITTMAAVAFAGLLVVIIRSGEVRELLTNLVRAALQIPG